MMQKRRLANPKAGRELQECVEIGRISLFLRRLSASAAV